MLRLVCGVLKSLRESRVRLAVAALVSIQAATASYADVLTFAYEGVIDSAVGGPEFEGLIGEVLFFQYTYDSDTPDTNPDGGIGEFPAVSSIQLCVGPGGNVVRYHEDTGNVTLTDSVDPDVSRSVSVIGLGQMSSGTILGGLGISRAGMTLGESLTILPTDTLPDFQLDPVNFIGNELFIEWGDGAGRISATDLRITSTVVPEPTAVGLVTLVIAGAAGVTRRRS